MRILLVVAFLMTSAFSCGQSDADKSDGDYASCAARVRRDYPVPPGNKNAQDQMIREECGQD